VSRSVSLACKAAMHAQCRLASSTHQCESMLVMCKAVLRHQGVLLMQTDVGAQAAERGARRRPGGPARQLPRQPRLPALFGAPARSRAV
jgi:hypothetical protein